MVKETKYMILFMVKEAKYKIFLAHLLLSTAERDRGGLLGGPDVFRRLPRGSPLKMPDFSSDDKL